MEMEPITHAPTTTSAHRVLIEGCGMISTSGRTGAVDRREFIAMLASTPAISIPGGEDAQGPAPGAAPKPLSITRLGTGTPSPSLERQSSGYLIEVGRDYGRLVLPGSVRGAGRQAAAPASGAERDGGSCRLRDRRRRMEDHRRPRAACRTLSRVPRLPHRYRDGSTCYTGDSGPSDAHRSTRPSPKWT
jgi:hypothetical protein